jgi:hypothetical protein
MPIHYFLYNASDRPILGQVRSTKILSVAFVRLKAQLTSSHPFSASVLWDPRNFSLTSALFQVLPWQNFNNYSKFPLVPIPDQNCFVGCQSSQIALVPYS